MTPAEARALLGVGPDDPIDLVLDRFRTLQLRHHPDLVGGDDPDATGMSARLNIAVAVLRAESSAPPSAPGEGVTTAPSSPAGHDGAEHPLADRGSFGDEDAPITIAIDGDSILVGAPPDETFVRLLEAGAGLGGIGHLDPRLGLLELVVRFEDGPTCSVLLTFQGRSHGTEVFCEMESIEADPTPPIAPVLEALVDELMAAVPHPRP